MTFTPIRKIVFIEPKPPGYHVYSKWGLPRLGTLQLGAILKKAGYDVDVYIEEMHGIDFQDVFDADLVGITTITSTAPRAYEMAEQIRKAGVPVFMGGPHVSFLPEEALRYCDFVMIGETEETIVPFVEALSSGKGMEFIPGLARIAGEGVVKTPPPEHCADLDKYPFPDFGLIKGSKKFKGDLSVTPIMTSRGCPFGCNFCAVTRMFGRGYRFRSVDNVIEELKLRKPEYTFFYDDNFAANVSHTKELLRRMIAEGIKTKWSAQVRTDAARDEELLALMKESGCYLLFIGLESINPETLKALNKSQTPEQIESALRAFQRYDFNVHGMFMFGADQDDVSTIRETVKFAKRVGITSVQLMILTPLPGTPVFSEMERDGRLLSKDWGYYDGHHVVFKPKRMTYLELQKKTYSAMLKFYSLRKIMSHLNRFDIWRMVLSAYGWRMTRRAGRNVKEFTKHLKEIYKQAGDSITEAGHGIHIKARRTTDDLKEYFGSLNWDVIRRRKAASNKSNRNYCV